MPFSCSSPAVLCALCASDGAMSIVILRSAPLPHAGRRISLAFLCVLRISSVPSVLNLGSSPPHYFSAGAEAAEVRRCKSCKAATSAPCPAIARIPRAAALAAERVVMQGML